ncbi:MAG: glycosyl transferase [Fibrobacteres bacterium]|nr:glycosyl transferase [Fibrobacterota bacterium]
MESPWILVLSHEFPPLGGGGGKNLYLLCRELTRRGVKVRVWTVDPAKRNQWKHEFPVEYIQTERTERFETNPRSMRSFILGACRLAWRSRNDRPALVLANMALPAGVAGWFVCRVLKAPLAVWHHGDDIHAGRPEGPGFFHRFLLRRIWNRSALNFFLSRGLQDMAEALGSPKRPVILPACPSPEILAIAPGAAPEPEKRYFLFLGRFDPVKNPLLVLEAMLLLKSKKALTRTLRMVGSGGLRGAVYNTIRNDYLTQFVALEDAAAFDKVPDLLRSAYALVVPSRIEGFNTTILEAAHFGVPAIASDVPGIRDFVRHGETGMLFPANDAAGLAEAMKALSADPALRDTLGRNAREAVVPYRPERVTDTFLRHAAEIASLLSIHAPGARNAAGSPNAAASRDPVGSQGALGTRSAPASADKA